VVPDDASRFVTHTALQGRRYSQYEAIVMSLRRPRRHGSSGRRRCCGKPAARVISAGRATHAAARIRPIPAAETTQVGVVTSLD
jgi:hypothetical protein